MATKATVRWREQQVRQAIKQRTDQVLHDLAEAIQRQADANILENSQIDTGFLFNSSYIVTPLADTFGSTSPGPDKLHSSKTGQMVWREGAAQPPRVGNNRAVVGFAAAYAIWPELDNSYLYRAANTIVENAVQIIDEAIR